MKRLAFIAAALLLTFFAVNASAQCQGIQVTYSGPIGGPIPGSSYNYYMPDCGTNWAKSGPISSAVLNCSGYSGWSIGNTGYLGGVATLSMSFVPAADKMMNSAHWLVSAKIQGSTPDQNYYVYAQINITVTHNGVPTSYAQVVSWNGYQGDDNGCQWHTSDYFSASAGDTISVQIKVANPLGGGSVAISNPMIQNVF